MYLKYHCDFYITAAGGGPMIWLILKMKKHLFSALLLAIKKI